MNVLNEKARVLRTQIEAENKKDNPNQKEIQFLQKELDKCLEELKWK